jgi:hypothetical protein
MKLVGLFGSKFCRLWHFNLKKLSTVSVVKIEALKAETKSSYFRMTNCI